MNTSYNLTNMYKIIADFIRFVHVLIALFLLVGLILLPFASHLMHGAFGRVTFFVVIAIFIGQVLFQQCPLTILENMMRRRHDPTHNGPSSYTLDFFEKRGIALQWWHVTCLLFVICCLSTIFVDDVHHLFGW